MQNNFRKLKGQSRTFSLTPLPADKFKYPIDRTEFNCKPR